MKKTLVIFAHPFFELSVFNSKVIDVYQNKENIVFKDLYEIYPEFHISAYRERKKVKEFDRIIFHFPLIWLGIPPLLSLWISEVLDQKWLNPYTEKPLKDKEVVIIVSSGGSAQNFSENGQYKRPVEDFILPLTKSMEANQAVIKDIITIHSARQKTNSEIGHIKQIISKYLN